MIIKFIIITVLIFLFAVFMTMVGKGGGNFYILILVMAGTAMHQAATTGQFILFSASASALIIFHKYEKVLWPVAILIGVSTSLTAFLGGFFSHEFSSLTLKMIFTFLLFSTGIIMLLPLSYNKKIPPDNNKGYWTVRMKKKEYIINLRIVIPLTMLIGFAAGMCGVSGGSFLVPLMVLGCGLPMHIAVGTATTLIAATAVMGFTGHAIQGDFNPDLAIPLALITIIGGIIGGKRALSTRPKYLKQLFAFSNIAAALFMFIHTMKTN